jgi:hypothetical protein
MIPATGRPELERWLASAAFNAYYGFRLREFGAGECTIKAPFRDEFERPGGAVSGPVFMAAADVAIWLAVATRRGTSEKWSPRISRPPFCGPRAVSRSRARRACSRSGGSWSTPSLSARARTEPR